MEPLGAERIVVVVSEKKKQVTADTGQARVDSKKPAPEEAESDNHLKELSEELEVEKARSEDYLRRLQYLQADFENYRKRVEKEMSDSRQYGNQRLLSDLIVVNDELELALRKAEESNENPTITQGLAMVHKRLQNLLSKEGVEKIQSLGSKFNPDFHEAALQVESNDEEEGTIVEEIRQGYSIKGKVLRPSIVKVAARSGENESKSEKDSLEDVGNDE